MLNTPRQATSKYIPTTSLHWDKYTISKILGTAEAAKILILFVQRDVLVTQLEIGRSMDSRCRPLKAINR